MSLIKLAKGLVKAPYELIEALPHRKDYKGEFWHVVLPRMRRALSPTTQNCDRYNQAVLNFLEKKLPMPADKSLPEPTPVERMRVWVMWWQGKEQMPPIVKACHESLLRHARGLEVVLITRDNVSEYVKLPEAIRRKLDEGRILLPALSDYVRASLLSNYGGIWVDSTMYFVRDIPDAAINNVFFTNHRTRETSDGICISKARWNGQFLATNETHSRIFEKMRRMWEQYWTLFNSNIEYLMVDFFMARIFETDPEANQLLESVDINNNNLYKLTQNINTPYDEDLWQQLCQNEEFFKLTYKMQFVDGDTFYKRLIDGKLTIQTTSE